MNNTAGRKFAVITGGSSGIGYEFAKVCAEEDFGVLLIADQGVDGAAGAHVLRRGSQHPRGRFVNL